MTDFSKTMTSTQFTLNAALACPTVEQAEAVLNELRKADPNWMDRFAGPAALGCALGFRQHHRAVPVATYVALRAAEDRTLRFARRFNGFDPSFRNEW